MCVRSIANIGVKLDKDNMGTDTYTLLIGAFVGVLALMSILARTEGRTPIERWFQRLLKLAFVTGMCAWLVMWFTEPAIWSSTAKTCVSYASIDLKGQVYRTCSYLVHRHQTAEWAFGASWVIGAVCILFGFASR